MYSGRTSYANHWFIINGSQDLVGQVTSGTTCLCGMMVWGPVEAGVTGASSGLFPSLCLLPSAYLPPPYLCSMWFTWAFSQHRSLREGSDFSHSALRLQENKMEAVCLQSWAWSWNHITPAVLCLSPWSQGVRSTPSVNGRSVKICMSIFKTLN